MLSIDRFHLQEATEELKKFCVANRIICTEIRDLQITRGQYRLQRFAIE
jgi:hypothetical protein